MKAGLSAEIRHPGTDLIFYTGKDTGFIFPLIDRRMDGIAGRVPGRGNGTGFFIWS